MAIRIERVDHLVLTVASIPASVEFYTRVLHFEAVEAEGRWSLHFGHNKINLHQADHPFEPKAAHPVPGSADFCLLTGQTAEDTLVHLGSLGVAVEEGPVERKGALGPMTSVYLRDPDGNLLEISRYH